MLGAFEPATLTHPAGNKNFRGTDSICPSRSRKSEHMKLTVTLTGQRTLTINLPDWPVIAWANDCSNGGSYLVVRRHRDDGDTLIYAMYLSRDLELRGGKRLPSSAGKTTVIETVKLVCDDMMAHFPDDHGGRRIFWRLMESCCRQLSRAL